MLTMDQIHRIRQLYYEQGLTNLCMKGNTILVH